jgi:hypothetical protein
MNRRVSIEVETIASYKRCHADAGIVYNVRILGRLCCCVLQTPNQPRKGTVEMLVSTEAAVRKAGVSAW